MAKVKPKKPTKQDRRRTRTCAKCPKRDTNGVCLLRGQLMVDRHPMCDYGKHLLHNAYSAEWMRKKLGCKKRPEKPLPPPEDFED